MGIFGTAAKPREKVAGIVNGYQVFGGTIGKTSVVIDDGRLIPLFQALYMSNGGLISPRGLVLVSYVPEFGAGELVEGHHIGRAYPNGSKAYFITSLYPELDDGTKGDGLVDIVEKNLVPNGNGRKHLTDMSKVLSGLKNDGGDLIIPIYQESAKEVEVRPAQSGLDYGIAAGSAG